jgi:DedD protein
MEVRVRERLVGALVLVALVVLLVPALLKGPQQPQGAAPAPQLKSVEVTLDDGKRPAADDALVPEPAAPAARTVPAATDDAPGSAARAAPPPEPAAAVAPAAAGGDRPAPTTSREPGEPPAWAVQLGAFSTREKAEGLVADLRRRGYSAFVLEYRAGGQVLHRVRVGPEQDRARAVAIAERLRKDGFQPVVAPHP